MSKKIRYSHDLSELPGAVLKSISSRLGVTAVLHTSKELKVAKTQEGSLRTRIVAKIAELQATHGTVLTDKGNIAEGPAREAYIKWYLSERKDDIGKKHPQEHFEKWAIVHLKDALKHRKESVTDLVKA